jgi:hypothetical protein
MTRCWESFIRYSWAIRYSGFISTCDSCSSRTVMHPPPNWLMAAPTTNQSEPTITGSPLHAGLFGGGLNCPSSSGPCTVPVLWSVVSPLIGWRLYIACIAGAGASTGMQRYLHIPFCSHIAPRPASGGQCRRRWRLLLLPTGNQPQRTFLPAPTRPRRPQPPLQA